MTAVWPGAATFWAIHTWIERLRRSTTSIAIFSDW